MLMKIFIKTKICLILLTIQKVQSFLNSVNKNIMGKMQDEFKGKLIREFFGLKTKMYSLGTVDNEEIKKAKEVNKNVVKNIMHIEL